MRSRRPGAGSTTVGCRSTLSRWSSGRAAWPGPRRGDPAGPGLASRGGLTGLTRAAGGGLPSRTRPAGATAAATVPPRRNWPAITVGAWSGRETGSHRRTGPSSRSPMRTTHSAVITQRPTRCPRTNVPFILPASRGSIPPAHAAAPRAATTRASGTAMSESGSRPIGTWPRPLTCTPIAACGRQAPGLLPLDRSTATTCPSPAIPSPGTSAEITPLSCLRPSPGRPGTLDRVRSGLQPSTAAVAADGNDCRHPHQGRNQPRRFLAQPLRAEHTARLKVPCLTAGMIAGADSIDDMDLLRHGARLRRAGDGGGAVGRWRAGRAELPWVPGQPGCRPLPWRPDRPVRRPGYEFHDRCGPGPAG